MSTFCFRSRCCSPCPPIDIQQITDRIRSRPPQIAGHSGPGPTRFLAPVSGSDPAQSRLPLGSAPHSFLYSRQLIRQFCKLTPKNPVPLSEQLKTRNTDPLRWWDRASVVPVIRGQRSLPSHPLVSVVTAPAPRLVLCPWCVSVPIRPSVHCSVWTPGMRVDRGRRVQ